MQNFGAIVCLRASYQPGHNLDQRRKHFEKPKDQFRPTAFDLKLERELTRWVDAIAPRRGVMSELKDVLSRDTADTHAATNGQATAPGCDRRCSSNTSPASVAAAGVFVRAVDALLFVCTAAFMHKLVECVFRHTIVCDDIGGAINIGGVRSPHTRAFYLSWLVDAQASTTPAVANRA